MTVNEFIDAELGTMLIRVGLLLAISGSSMA